MSLEPRDGRYVVRLEEDHEIVARTVLIATGAQYRRLPVDGLSSYEGLSVFYAAGPPEAQLCGASRVGVVGGGNSAGQAAVWLARGGALVTLLHRRADLRETMSDYLIRELERYGVAVRDRSEVAALHGDDGRLEAVTLQSGERLAFSFLFLFLGGLPCTEWLGDTVARDENGFVLTGTAAGADSLLETSLPRRLRRGRRPLRLDEALRDRRRRRCDGRPVRARPARGAHRRRDRLSFASARSASMGVPVCSGTRVAVVYARLALRRSRHDDRDRGAQMSRRTMFGALVSALIVLGVGVSTAAAAPVPLILPQSAAFSVLGASCGGIQEQTFATGFDATSGFPTGDVYLSTRCGGSGRGGGYHTTTYTAWASVSWDFTATVISYGRLTSAPTVDPSFSAFDANGNQLYNQSNNAYLVLAPGFVQAARITIGVADVRLRPRAGRPSRSPGQGSPAQQA